MSDRADRDLLAYQRFLSVESAARQLGVTRNALEAAIREGKLRAVPTPGRRLVHPDWLEEYQRQRKARQPEEQENRGATVVVPAGTTVVVSRQQVRPRIDLSSLSSLKTQEEERRSRRRGG